MPENKDKTPAEDDINMSNDGDGLSSGQSSSSFKSSSSTSLDTEEVVAFALELDEEDGSGQEESAGERASSVSSGTCLGLAKYFVSSAGDMMQQHERARKEADMYMAEVTLATKMLPLTFSMAFQQTFFFDRVWSGSTGRAGP